MSLTLRDRSVVPVSILDMAHLPVCSTNFAGGRKVPLQSCTGKQRSRAFHCERGRQLRRPQNAIRYLRTQLSPNRGTVVLGCMTVAITDNPMNSAIVTAQKVIHVTFSWISAQRA